MAIDLNSEPLGHDKSGEPVYLRDIWPSNDEIAKFVRRNITRAMFKEAYGEVFDGDAHWRKVKTPASETYAWDDESTYVRNPPYFSTLTKTPKPIENIEKARILAVFGDKITTDHISPAGAIKAASPAGKWLQEQGVAPADFNQYGTRRGNHEVMMRGTFANIRIKNQMMKDASGAVPEGGLTKHYPGGETLSIYEAAMQYAQEGAPLVVFAGSEYGNGSSRDWAAKGTALLGVRAVIAQSFERIHRSNLVGHGRAAADLRARNHRRVAWPHRRRNRQHSRLGQRPFAAPDAGGRDRFRRWRGEKGSCWPASIRSTSWNISTTAAFCPSFCASSPARVIPVQIETE